MSSTELASLQHIRREVLTRFFALGADPSPKNAAQFQRVLATRILSAEALLGSARGADRQTVQHHIRQLQAHGDALGWRYLHPHAIRQLRKGGLRGQRLSSQQDAVEDALELVDTLAGEDVSSIAADLTADLRLGDVVVFDDPDAPTIVECKRTLPPHDSLLLGRRGRQAARLHGTARYLRNGSAEMHGEVHTRLCIESTVSVEAHWATVNAAVDAALSTGASAIHELESGAFLLVLHKDENIPSSIERHTRDFQAIMIGAHTRVFDDDAPLMPPPLAWPLPERARAELMEGNLVAVTILDPTRLGRIAADRGRLLTVLDGGDLEVVHQGLTYHLSSRFIGDCLYNYCSMSTQVDSALELVDAAYNGGVVPIPPGTLPPTTEPGPPPRVRHVHSRDDLRRHGEGSTNPGDLVMLAPDVLEYISANDRPQVVYYQAKRHRKA